MEQHTYYKVFYEVLPAKLTDRLNEAAGTSKVPTRVVGFAASRGDCGDDAAWVVLSGHWEVEVAEAKG